MPGPFSVLLTGGNSGIGFHMASTLVEDGHQVVVLDLQGHNLEPLQARYPGRLRHVPCDVAEEEQVRQGVAEVWQEWGRIDALVNNACLCRFGSFASRPSADWRREIEVNLGGYLHTIAAVLPLMRRQGHGVIHNVSSGVGLTGFANIAIYAATKGAIETLTRSLAPELAPLGITVDLMHPPLTRTPSAAPLGVPQQVMADPAVVGRKLARRVGSRKPVITPDLGTAFSLFFFRHFRTGGPAPPPADGPGSGQRTDGVQEIDRPVHVPAGQTHLQTREPPPTK